MNFEHPCRDDDGRFDPDWGRPLHLAAVLLAERDERCCDRFFDPHDFSIVGRYHRRSRPAVYSYTHVYTRRTLHLDQTIRAYTVRYPRPESSAPPSIRFAPSLRAAVDELLLWELPWMKPALQPIRRGLDWDDRWDLFDGDSDLLADTSGITGVIGPEECSECARDIAAGLLPAPPTWPPMRAS